MIGVQRSAFTCQRRNLTADGARKPLTVRSSQRQNQRVRCTKTTDWLTLISFGRTNLALEAFAVKDPTAAIGADGDELMSSFLSLSQLLPDHRPPDKFHGTMLHRQEMLGKDQGFRPLRTLKHLHPAKRFCNQANTGLRFSLSQCIWLS
jgi:hypothetical protein